MDSPPPSGGFLHLPLVAHLVLSLSMSTGAPISKATTFPPLAATANTRAVSPVCAPMSTMLQPGIELS